MAVSITNYDNGHEPLRGEDKGETVCVGDEGQSPPMDSAGMRDRGKSFTLARRTRPPPVDPQSVLHEGVDDEDGPFIFTR